MAENSKIEWTDHTFNPWRGCTRVSEGCEHCYAEIWSKRNPKVLGEWGPGKPRVLASEAMWRVPVKWNKAAKSQPRRPRVFCASLADWLDDEVPVEWLARLLSLIQNTPFLNWLLLTKRPQNFTPRMRAAMEAAGEAAADFIDRWLKSDTIPRNVWIGTTVENQKRADERIPVLVGIPAQVRFLSCEPLLGRVSLSPHLVSPSPLHWVIAGGESGPGARPMHPDWARSLRDQCAAARVPFFFKQWGEHVPVTPLYHGREEEAEDGTDPDRTAILRDDGSLWDVETDGQPPLEGRPWIIERVGKASAGALLDGARHQAWPVE